MDFQFAVDSHQDIAWNACSLGRDFTRGIKDWEEDPSITQAQGKRMVSLPDLLDARVRLVIGTIFALPESGKDWNKGIKYYRNPQEAYQLGQEQIEFYHSLAAKDKRFELLGSRQDLDRFLTKLEVQPEKLGIIISMEGADPITGPEQLEEWVKKGLRLIGPAWRETRYCGGTATPGPLKPAGFQLLAEMQRLGVILDVSHMAEESFYQAMEAYQGPVISSHSNCRHFVNTDRQLSDEMIKLLFQRQAVIGVVLYNKFLTGKPEATLEDALRHIDHLCQLAGDTTRVGIGSDFDGGFGSELIPSPMKGLKDLYLLAEALVKRGYSEKDVLNIFHGNWIRHLSESLPG